MMKDNLLLDGRFKKVVNILEFEEKLIKNKETLNNTQITQDEKYDTFAFETKNTQSSLKSITKIFIKK